MPKVPDSHGVLPVPGIAPDATAFMLAAADMHANGRLFEPPPAPEPTTADRAQATEAFDPFKTKVKGKDQSRHRSSYPVPP